MQELREEIYEKDYSFPEEIPNDTQEEEIFELMTNGGLLSKVGERLRSIPHYVDPESKKKYENSIQILNKFAKERHGYIRANIDYINYEAFIKVKMCFFEFLGKEELKILSYLSEKADAVCFYQSKDDNKIVLSARFNYFQIFDNIFDILEEEIEKMPDLSALMSEQYEKKRAEEISTLLEDEEIYDKIKAAADTVNVTPEEWLEKFIETYEDNFDEIEKLINDNKN